jgi:hypothetical protein
MNRTSNLFSVFLLPGFHPMFSLLFFHDLLVVNNKESLLQLLEKQSFQWMIRMDRLFLLISPFLLTIFYKKWLWQLLWKAVKSEFLYGYRQAFVCSTFKKPQLNCQRNHYSGRTPNSVPPEYEVELPATLVNSENNPLSLQVFLWYEILLAMRLCKTYSLFACFN